MNKSLVITILVILDALTTIITNTKTFIEMFSWHFKIKNKGGTLFICISVFTLRELPYLCSIFWTEIGSDIKSRLNYKNSENMALLLCLFLLYFV